MPDEIVARFPHRPPRAFVRRNQRARFEAANVWWGSAGLFSRLLHSSKITIAAAKGLCLETGLYLALYSDLTVASETAKFGVPAWRHVGVNGDISMLIAAVGLKRAKSLIYCGAEWDARTALAYGLIDGVAPVVRSYGCGGRPGRQLRDDHARCHRRREAGRARLAGPHADRHRPRRRRRGRRLGHEHSISARASSISSGRHGRSGVDAAALAGRDHLR